MNTIEEMVPIVVCTGMFALIFGIVYIRSRENMALIERGMNPRNATTGPRPFVYLKYGLLLVGSGFGLLAAYFIDCNVSHTAVTPGGQVYYKENPAIYFALIAIGGGLGLIVSFLIEKKYWLDRKKDE
jgi:uncharacterized protein DUF6249